MKTILALLVAAQTFATAQSSGLFAFDNAVGRGTWTPEQQASTLKQLGYDGISYNYTKPKDLAVWLATCKAHGIKLQGLYIHTFPDKEEAYDPAFKEAIPMLKDSGCVIWMTLREAKDKTRNYDKESVSIVNDIADQAAAHGLQVAVYPHAGFYVATAADSMRISKLWLTVTGSQARAGARMGMWKGLSLQSWLLLAWKTSRDERLNVSW